MNKIKLVGAKNIPIFEELDDQKEYLLALKGSVDGVFSPSKQGDEEIEKTFHFRVQNYELVQEVGGKPLKIEKGFTPSQKLMFAIQAYLKRTGKDGTYEEYEKVVQKLIDGYNSKQI